MMPYASPAEVAALSTNAQRTAYGRRLKSVQGKEQPVALAVAQTPGSAGYASAVLAQIASFQPGSKRLEAMVEPRVCLFDGWLALTTDGTVRFWTRDDVRAFFACGEGEALIAEYILSWGRRVDIGVEGQPLVVQAAPKGGWWMRTLSFVNERHIHIVRALLALVPDGAQDGLQWEKRVLYGPFPDDVYSALAAVTASIFSTMAVYNVDHAGVLDGSGSRVYRLTARLWQHLRTRACAFRGTWSPAFARWQGRWRCHSDCFYSNVGAQSRSSAAAFCCWRGSRRVVCEWRSSASMGLG